MVDDLRLLTAEGAVTDAAVALLVDNVRAVDDSVEIFFFVPICLVNVVLFSEVCLLFVAIFLLRRACSFAMSIHKHANSIQI